MKVKRIISMLLILAATFIFNPSITFAATNITVATPATVKAESAGDSSIKVSWGAVSGANGYKIYRSTSLTGTYSNIVTITSTSYKNTGLTAGKTYYYKMKAFKYSGSTKVYSKYTSTVSAKPVPSAPANLKASSAGYSSTKLSWNLVSGASGYQVYRATSSTGTYSYVKTTSYTTYTNTNLTTGKTYYYKVRAYKMVGTTKVYGKFSTMASAKPIPSTPVNLKGTSESNTSIKVSWGAVSGASGYRVYRAASSTGTFSYLKTTTATSYINTDLTSGKAYYYKVRAYHSEGTTKIYSNYSTVVKIVTSVFDSLTATKNIAGEFTEIGDGVIAILTNNNSYPVYLTATMVFYDETGSMLEEDTAYNDYFEPGKQCVLHFNGPYDDNYNSVNYSSYKIIYSVDSTEDQISNLSDIKITSNIGSDNVMVEATNSGSKTADYTDIGIVFYKDGKAIAYASNYADCSTPGSTDYLEFSLPYDENFNTIQIDSYKVYVNYSYSYSGSLSLTDFDDVNILY